MVQKNMASKGSRIRAAAKSMLGDVRPLQMLLYGLVGYETGNLMKPITALMYANSRPYRQVIDSGWNQINQWEGNPGNNPFGNGGAGFIAKVGAAAGLGYEAYRGFSGKSPRSTDVNSILPLIVGWALDPVSTGGQVQGGGAW